jgi:hypothetical protein
MPRTAVSRSHFSTSSQLQWSFFGWRAKTHSKEGTKTEVASSALPTSPPPVQLVLRNPGPSDSSGFSPLFPSTDVTYSDPRLREKQRIAREALTNYLQQLLQEQRLDTLLAVWHSWSMELKRENSKAVLLVLAALSQKGDAEQAAQLMDELPELRVPLSEEICSLWISCHEASGDWQAAEQAWRRMLETAVKPSPSTYCLLIQVLLTAVRSHPELLDRIESLHAEMRSANSPAGVPMRFERQQYELLVQRSQQLGLSAEATKWQALATKDGEWSALSSLAISKPIASILALATSALPKELHPSQKPRLVDWLAVGGFWAVSLVLDHAAPSTGVRVLGVAVKIARKQMGY